MWFIYCRLKIVLVTDALSKNRLYLIINILQVGLGTMKLTINLLDQLANIGQLTNFSLGKEFHSLENFKKCGSVDRTLGL